MIVNFLRRFCTLLFLSLLITILTAGCTATPEQLIEGIAAIQLAEESSTDELVATSENEGDAIADSVLEEEDDGLQETDGVDVQSDTIEVPNAVVLADSLRVRTGPGAEFDVIGAISRGDEVEVTATDESGEWYRIGLPSIGEPAWAAAEFLQLSEPTSGSVEGADVEDPVTEDTVAEEPAEGATDSSIILRPTPTPEAEPTVPTAITQPERMNVRSGPGTAYAVVTGVDGGTALEIFGVSPDGAWYQVILPEADEPAWLFADLTTQVGPLEVVPVVPEEEIPEAPEPVVAALQAVGSVAAPAPAGGGSFGYGVQAHMLGGGISEAVNATGNMGFNWIKQQVEWRIFEGSQGALDFSELRRIVDAAGGRGISVLFSVVNAPDWAREPGFDASVGGPPADPGTYAAFVGRMAGEFCGSSLRAIEVWNEQNLHYEWGNRALNPGDYMDLLRAAYGSIKANCPSMLVISGALTPAGDAGPLARDDFAYLEGMYQNGLAAVADGIGVHPSGFNVPPWVRWQDACATIQQTGNFFNGPCDTPHHSWSFLSTLEGYRNIMVVYGDAGKRLWPTEFGWAVGPAVNGAYAYADDNSADEQAAWTVEAFNIMRNSGYVGPAFLWNLNFRVIADGSEKAQWGIVRNDYTGLPVYGALQAMPK